MCPLSGSQGVLARGGLESERIFLLAGAPQVKTALWKANTNLRLLARKKKKIPKLTSNLQEDSGLRESQPITLHFFHQRITPEVAGCLRNKCKIPSECPKKKKATVWENLQLSPDPGQLTLEECVPTDIRKP